MYNYYVKHAIRSILLSTTIVLTACSASDTEESSISEDDVRTAEVGVAAALNLAKNIASFGGTVRPAASLGIFTSSYLSQGVFINVASAMNGITAQEQLIAGQNVPTTSETFHLLTELATLMQVHIPDMLNRSTNRAATLNDYIASLEASGQVAEQKYNELQIRLEQLQDRRREERNTVSTIDREISTAFRNEDYSTAAGRQESLVEAQTALAETEVQMDQTRDLVRRFEDMLEIADERLEAIVRNREILIAGLKVTELPGVESLELLNENQRSRRNRDRDDIFGSEYIRK